MLLLEFTNELSFIRAVDWVSIELSILLLIMRACLHKNYILLMPIKSPHSVGLIFSTLSYVSTELREISQEDLNTFLDDFNHYVFEMISSSDTNSKMGGILAIVVLINADVCNTGTRISRSQENPQKAES